MSTIGRISVNLEAQYADFSASTQGAAKDIGSLGEAAEGAGGGIGSFFESFAEGLGIGAGMEVVSEGFKAATEAIGEAVNKIREWIGESLKTQQEAVRTSNALHLHVDTLEGLQAAGKRAGLSQEEVANALEKTNHAIGEAVTKGGEGAEAFAKLGLNAKQLAGQSLDKSIGQIADAISHIQNPAEQAAAAGSLLGERLGPRLLPLLQKGSAGIAEITEEARKAGVALSDVDAGKMAAAQASLDQVGERFEGIKNQLTVALAPAIKAIADGVIGLIPPADKMKQFFLTAFRSIVLSVAETQDNLKGLEAGLLHLASIGARISTFGIRTGLSDALSSAGDFIENSGSAAEAATKWLDSIDKHAQEAGEALETGINQPISAVTEHVEDQSKKIQEILEHLKSTVAEFGLDEGGKSLVSLKALGADDATLTQARELNKQLDGLERHKKDLDESKRIIEESLSPLDKYQEKIEEIARLYREHLIDAKQRQDALNKAAGELDKGKTGAEKDQHSAAEVRRFDFNIGKSNKPSGVQGQLLEQAKKEAINTDRIKFIQEQFYNNMLNKPQVILYNF